MAASQIGGIEKFTAPAQGTFFGMPAGRAAAPSSAALLGIPFDALSTEQRGAADGPDALRACSPKLGGYSVRDGRWIDHRQAAADLGNLRGEWLDPQRLFEGVRGACRAVLAAGAAPLLVGGDHSITYPAVTAAAETYPDLQLLQVDAHYDATDPAERGRRWDHGSFVRNLIEDGAVRGERVLHVGVRDFQWSPSGAEFLATHQSWSLPMGEYRRSGLKSLGRRLAGSAGAPTYLSIDLDAADPAFAPGVAEVMVGGFSARELIHLLEAVQASPARVIAADLVEFVPARDIGGRTCMLAAHLLAEALEILRQQTPRS